MEVGMPSGLNACECNDMGEKDYSTTYMYYNFIVVMIILPFVAAFGIFSNFINCYIFTRPSLQSSVNVYLLSLSCSDLLVVSTGAFVFYSDSIRVYFPSFTEAATQGIIWVLPLGYIAQTCSVYYTVAAAADCYFKVCWHPLSVDWCTTFRAKLAALAIAVFSISYNALRFWQFALNPCFDELHNSTNIEVCPTALYYEIGVIYNVYMYMVLMTVLPFLLLSFLNVLIVRTVQRIHRMSKALDSEKNGVESKNGLALSDGTPTSDLSDEKQLASDNNAGGDDSVITMIMVVILFLACNTLALIVNIVETFFDPDPLVVQYMTDTSNLLVVFNSSVNYVIYMCFDGTYRSEFKNCVCCQSPCRRRAPRRSGEDEKSNGVLSNSFSTAYVTFESTLQPETRKKFVAEFGDYITVPMSSSSSVIPSKGKRILRFSSFDADSHCDDAVAIPLVPSLDHCKSGKRSKNKNGRVGSLTTTY